MPDRSSANVITTLNLKGGVGKTHTTWLLASVAEERGKRVLLIDTDTQGNLSTSFLDDDASPTPGVELLLHPGTDGDIARLIRRTRFPSIDIVPSSAAVAPFDLSNQAEWEKSDRHLAFLEPIAAVRSQYDYVLFDCPPRLSLVSFAALCASDAIIIPMEAADWGAQGVTQVTEAVHYVQDHHNPRLRLLGYLVSRYKRSRGLQQIYLRQLRKVQGKLAFDTVIVDLAAFERSVAVRNPITRHDPNGRAAGIARDFFDEVCRRLVAGGAGDGAGCREDPEPQAVAGGAESR
jgi:chromosome partitioning protein